MNDDHQARLKERRRFQVLDTPAELAFDAVVREAASAFDTPIALISLLDENRQWFKARVGLAAAETPLASSFCTHAVRGGEVFQVADASEDVRFQKNPLVTGDPNIRFYAGAPLTTASGTRIGTICVIDREKRNELTEAQQDRLKQLATRVMAMLEERKRRNLPTRLG